MTWLPRRSELSCLLAAIALSLLGTAGGFVALAKGEAATRLTLTFQIPEQPLATALQAYSAASGVAVLYASGVEVGRRSAPLNGEFTREVALKMLLGQSNLLVRYARADAVSLVDPTVVSADEPPSMLVGGAEMVLDTLHVAGQPVNAPDSSALSDYIGMIQRDIQQALKKSAAASGSYRVGLDLWVDPSRTIRRTQVFRSTGDTSRDLSITTALQGLTFRQSAPSNTPQPVRVMIVVRSM